MVDALASNGDEGRGVAAKSFGEVLNNLWSEDVRMGKPNQVNLDCSDLKSDRVSAEVKHLSKRKKRKQ